MNYKEVSDILGNGAFGLTRTLASAYRTTPPDRDCFIWDTYAFLLGYFYTFDGLDQTEVVKLIQQFSRNYPDHERQAMSQLWLMEATQFYGTHVWNIKTESHPMPDVILYNLCNPKVNKTDDIPLTAIDPLQMAQLWELIIDNITKNIIPPFNRYFQYEKT